MCTWAVRRRECGSVMKVIAMESMLQLANVDASIDVGGEAK